MSSEQFENNEDDLSTLLTSLTSRVETRLTRLVGEERKSAVRECEREIDEAEALIKEMREEASVAPPQYRSQMMSKVRKSEQEISAIKRSLSKYSQSAARDSLLSGGAAGRNASLETQQRSLLLQGTQALSRGSESLARTQQIAAETDAIGNDILEDLTEQREQLTRVQTRVHETDATLKRSAKTIRTMGRRVVTNKLILVVIIILEIAILAGVVYWKFFS